MIEHRSGPYANADEIHNYIKAALKMHGKKSIRQISLLTGYNYATIKRHVQFLVREGGIEKVQKEEYEYQLPKRGEDLT